MKTPSKVVLIFVIAGLISGWSFGSYSAWVQSLYAANSAQRSQYSDPLRGNYDPARGYQVWYAENVRLTKYADRQWTILCLGFPMALTLATFVCMAAGWLPRLEFGRIIPALLIVYGATVAVLFLTAVSRVILSLPGLILMAFLLARSVELATTRKSPRLLAKLCVALLACCLLWLLIAVYQSADSHSTAASSVFLCAIEISWAALYGKSLASDMPRPLILTAAN